MSNVKWIEAEATEPEDELAHLLRALEAPISPDTAELILAATGLDAVA